MKRRNGPLFAEPCEGLGLPKDALIEIVIPVYGLDDAPFEWNSTVCGFIISALLAKRTLLEPCWFYRHSPEGKVDSMILLDVDDLLFGVTKKTRREAGTQKPCP